MTSGQEGFGSRSLTKFNFVLNVSSLSKSFVGYVFLIEKETNAKAYARYIA